MMREIKFRGKATMPIVEMGEYGIRHNAGWVYGSYLDGYILSGVAVADTDCFSPEWWCRVDPKTVGQYTGLKDKNGEAIYEGDIVRCTATLDRANMVVVFEHGEFRLKFGTESLGYRPIGCFEKKVIGNIYENLELLKDGGADADRK